MRIVLPILLSFAMASVVAFTPREAMLSPQGEYVPGELLLKSRSKSAPKKFMIGSATIREQRDLSGGWHQVSLPDGITVSDGLEYFRRQPDIELAQPNFIYHIQANANDPRFSQLYGLNRIQAPATWDTTTGSSSVIVAILDLGVDYNHEDLNANMWRNPGESGTDTLARNKSTNGVDDDGNGYVDDVFGVDTINHDTDPMDDGGHGTHVAGTIGAVGNNSKGVVGVNWTVGIMAIKTHDAIGNGTSASVVDGFQYAAMMRNRGVNVRVTNSSWGGAPEAPSYDQALKDAIDAAGAAGILNVCAAGNSGSNNDQNPFYPSSYDSPSIVSVAASDQNDNRAGFSSFGAASVDLAAPGVAILSTLPGTYGSLSGTSMATPHVAGAAALLCSYNPNLSMSQLKATLMNSVDVLPQWTGFTVTGGRLNVLRALQSIPTTNQIDLTNYFVRQQYLDFLGREPDAGGLAFWSNEIDQYGTDQICIRHRRIEVSAAFFIEAEFQQTGSFVIQLYRASFGRRPTFAEFSVDRNMLAGAQDIVLAQQALADQWVNRSGFQQAYPLTMTAEQFVGKLFDTAQLVPFTAEGQQQIDAMHQGRTRAEVLRSVIDLQAFKTREFNPNFVLMQYFGYLGRDPDNGGYLFWLDVLNNREANNYKSMVCGFITSAEYQLRFAPVVSRTNTECGQ